MGKIADFFLFYLVLLLTNYAHCQLSASTQKIINLLTLGDPDFDILTPDLIRSRGFDYELHSVPVRDGFVLGVHRIVNPFIAVTRSTVLMFHGLTGTSDTFLNTEYSGFINEPPEFVSPNLGFELAKRGHDVFLLDQRACYFSANNTLFSYDQPEYWNWSLDELALVDLPATIEHIRFMTGRKQIAYIAHSQGTMAMFMLMSREQKYNNIIRPFIALAPYFYLRNTIFNEAPELRVLPLQMVEQFLKQPSSRGPLLDRRIKEMSSRMSCGFPFSRELSCTPMARLVFTFGSFLVNPILPNVNVQRLPVFIQSSTYDVFGTRQISQYLQSFYSEYTTQLSLSTEENARNYGQVNAPIYDAERITCDSIILFSAVNDVIADPDDVQRLIQTMATPPLFHFNITEPTFGHLTFFFGERQLIVPLVTEPVIQLMDYFHPFVK